MRCSQCLQIGYRILEDAKDSLKCVEYVDEKRTISAYYHEKLRSGARVGTMGKPQIIDTDIKFCIFVSLGFLRDHTGIINKKFISFWMQSFLFEVQVNKNVKGSAQRNLNTGWLKNFLLPLPPLEEQKRIVAKIEELLPQIDHYEKAWSKLEEFNKRFPDDMQKSILQYAVQGKLVEQRSEEGTAEELYKKIQAEKQKLIEEKKIKKEKLLPVITAEEIPFDIPESWKWVRLGDLCNKIVDGAHNTPKYVEDGIPFLSVKNISSGKIDFSDTKYISLEEHQKLYERCNPEVNDILLSKVGTTGIPVKVDVEKEFSIFVSVALLKFSNELINIDYFVKVLLAPIVQKQCKENTKGVGNKNWVIKDIKNTIIPVPPLEEQKRIAAKIEELLPLCEKLKK